MTTKGAKILSCVSMNKLFNLSLAKNMLNSYAIEHILKNNYKCLKILQLSGNQLNYQGFLSIVKSSLPILRSMQLGILFLIKAHVQ